MMTGEERKAAARQGIEKDEEGTLLAHGTSTLMPLPGKGINLKGGKVSGWR